jgi:hypothetical protein
MSRDICKFKKSICEISDSFFCYYKWLLIGLYKMYLCSMMRKIRNLMNEKVDTVDLYCYEDAAVCVTISPDTIEKRNTVGCIAMSPRTPQPKRCLESGADTAPVPNKKRVSKKPVEKWEPFRGEIIPPPRLYKPLSREEGILAVKLSQLKMLASEAELVAIDEHLEELDISMLLCSIDYPDSTDYPIGMRDFTTLINDSGRPDSFNLINARTNKDDQVLCTSSLVALLATAPKDMISHMLRSKDLYFCKLAMATIFQFRIRHSELGKRYYDIINIVGTDVISRVQVFVCQISEFASVSDIVYSARVDQLLWKCEYPQAEIIAAVEVCNRLMANCSYDFFENPAQFRLWQSINAYLVCVSVRETQGIALDKVELQKALGIHSWLSFENRDNVAFLERIREKWSTL